MDTDVKREEEACGRRAIVVGMRATERRQPYDLCKAATDVYYHVVMAVLSTASIVTTGNRRRAHVRRRGIPCNRSVCDHFCRWQASVILLLILGASGLLFSLLNGLQRMQLLIDRLAYHLEEGLVRRP